MSIIIDEIPSLIPIKINFEIPRSHGIDTINSPTLVILSLRGSYFLPELIFFFYDFLFFYLVCVYVYRYKTYYNAS
jgi:hypothetical protein